MYGGEDGSFNHRTRKKDNVSIILYHNRMDGIEDMKITSPKVNNIPDYQILPYIRHVCK